VRLAVPATVEGTVTASGSGTPLTARAGGTVTFTNHSPNPIPVADQTIVSTTTGVTFETQDVITVPPGASMDVRIKAIDKGPGGNVDAGTITQMPDTLKNTLNGGTVTNKAPTTGGQSQPQRIIQGADYDAALSDLTARLQTELAHQAATPPTLPADGIVYPATVLPGQVTTSPPREQVVGQPVPSAGISASMTGSVLTSSTSEIMDVATRMLETAKPGTEFVPNSIRVATGDPIVGPDGVVAYQATASGLAYDRQLDEAQLRNAVKGMTISQAHVILDPLGQATITLSPDFMPTLPDDPNRIVLKIQPFEGTQP
jgi:hypothetical protein